MFAEAERQAINQPNTTLATIRSIELVPMHKGHASVYDLQVDENHNYIAGNIVVHNCSMTDADQLDIWYRAVEAVNRFPDMDEAFGITLIGDLLQLPPVKARWCFEAQCWEHFAENTTRLTKVWRQDSERFLSALNEVRAGNGGMGGEILTSLGMQWQTMLDMEFDGTTILSKNDAVSRYNQMGLDRIQGKEFSVSSRRWGNQQPEWGQNKRSQEWGIPPEMKLKVGAYVMILSNATDFHYVNGDCGWIESREECPGSNTDLDVINIRLVRTGETIALPRIVRGVEHSEKPDGWSGTVIGKSEDIGAYIPKPHFREKQRRYVTGQIEYFPLRLAFASTVHKTQGLTLDRCQVDIRDHFFSAPSMMYVALSRCRTVEGLRIVGQRDTFAKRCNIDPRVRGWI